jgi:hypothetical protein
MKDRNSEHHDKEWHRKDEAGVVCSASHEVCGEDDQIARNMGAEQAESEKAGDICGAGDHTEHGRQQLDTAGSVDLRC